MGVRIRYEFTSDFEGVEWRCDIHDSDYAAGINTANGNGFNITYNGNGSPPLANVFGSSCEVTLLWGDNDAFYTGFINDLKASNEHEFALVIYKDNNLYWVGNITGDSLMWNNENTQRELVINAIDGLGRLRDVKYDKITIGGRFGVGRIKKQVFEVLLDLLSLNNLDQFWGASDAYIEFEPHWVLNTSYRDWIDRLSIPNQTFYEHTNKDSPSPRLDILEGKPAYECLEIILTHLNMRIHHSDGRYFLQQVMGMTGANAAYRYTYYKSSTPISTSPYKWWQSENTTVARNAAVGTDVDVLAGGKFSYFQGLQAAEIDIPDQLFVFKDIQQMYSKRILNPNNCPFTESSGLGLVDGGSGKRIRLYFNLSTNSVGVLTQFSNRYFIRLTIKIEAGSYRLDDNGKNNFSDLEWTTVSGDTVIYDYPKAAYLLNHQNLVLETPELPWTSEDVTVTVTYDVIDSNTNASYTQNNLTYKIDYVGMSVVDADGPVGKQRLKIFNPTITDYENNTIYQHPDYLLNDFNPLTDSSSFKINTTTTTFVNVSSVDSGHSTDELISETILQDAMSLQIHPIQVYEGAITGSYEPYKTFQYGTDYYVFNGGTFNAASDEWSCQWWQSSPEVGTVGNPDRGGGRGYEYDGDDHVKTYLHFPTNWDHYGDVKDVMYGETIGGSGGNYSDAITTLTINSATESLFKSGDVVQIYNPETLEMLQEVTLTADVDATDTSISFSSVTLGNNIPPDSKIMLKGSEGIATPMLRTDQIQIAGNTYTDIAPNIEYYYGADTGSDVLPITASSTFYVVNTGTFNVTYSSSNISYNNTTHLFTNNTGSTKRFVVQGQLEIDSITLPAESSYDIRMAFGVNGSARTDTITRVVVSSDPDLTISTHGIIEVTSGTSFGLYMANYTNTDNIEWTRVKITIQSIN